MPPTLIYPAHKQPFETAPTEFIWNAVSDAIDYNLQITTDVTFMDFNFFQDVNKNSLNDTTFTFNNLRLDTMYFWRVSANNNDTTSEWSFIRMFLTGVKVQIFEKWNSNNDVNISPMPINNIATISFHNKSNNIDFINGQLLLFDNSFNLIAQIEISNIANEIIFDATKYYSGIYTLIIMNEKTEIIAAKEIIISR
jgi:hypothetical protein